MSYDDFLAKKHYHSPPVGFEPKRLPKCMFDFQRDVVTWACRRGRAALFLDTGLGKTLQSLAWAQQVVRHTKGRVLILAPLAVAQQTVRDGIIGLTDFRGLVIRAAQAAGWVFHSCVVIWKDPVTAMQRTKALGLLHKQIKKDSCMSRQGIPDYLVTFRKPGENAEPVSHTNEDFPVQMWQRYASPVWMDIDPSDTLQFRSAREDKDERHICPLQLEVIKRALKMWSNAGDTVLSPFAGIGSEGVCALEMGRKFVGVELKRSYYEQAVRNLESATPGAAGSQVSMFGDAV